MKNEASIEIDRPIEEVFNYTIHNVPEWSLIVVKDEIIEEKPEGVGTKFRITTEEKGRQMEFEGVVTSHEPPTGQTVFMEGRHFDIEADYIFEDLGGRTRLTQRSTVTGKGFVKVMFFLFGWIMQKANCEAGMKELNSLKEKLETRENQPA